MDMQTHPKYGKASHLIIIGVGRSGKDYAGQYLQETFGLSFSATSEYASEALFPILADKLGYSSREEAFNDRHNHRQLWFNLISDYCSEDLARLGKEILSKHPVLVGVRCSRELDALQKAFPDALTVWIDASKRLGEIEDNSSMTVSEAQADLVINNNDDLESYNIELNALGLEWLQTDFDVEAWRTLCESASKEANRCCGQSYDYFVELFSSKVDGALSDLPEGQHPAAIAVAREWGYSTVAEREETQDFLEENGYCSHGIQLGCCPAGCGS